MGRPANVRLGWAGYAMAIRNAGSHFDLWKTWGFGGYTGSLGGDHGMFVFTGGQDVQATTAAAKSSPGTWDYQKAYEGLGVASINGGTTGLGTFQHKANHDPTMEAYLGSFYMRNGTNVPPMIDWFDDAGWSGTMIPQFTRIAACVGNVLHGTGTSWDIEPQELFDTGYSGHTQAQIQVKAEQRGYETGLAMWGVFPGMVALVYGWRPSGGWYNMLTVGSTWPGVAGTIDYPRTIDVAHDCWCRGLIRGMSEAGNANARFRSLDATFYKPSAGGGGSSRTAKLQMNPAGSLAILSQKLSQSVWNTVCDQIEICPFDWVSSDGTSGYPVTPTGAYAAQLAQDREYGMHYCGEYLYGNPGTPDNPPFDYTSPNYVPGLQAAASSTAITTVVPTITSLAWNGTTLTCNAAHKYGIAYLRVYNGDAFSSADPEASYLGGANMTWTPNGGSPNTTYDAAYQACSFATSGASGHWRVVKAVSIKDDVAWASVQAP